MVAERWAAEAAGLDEAPYAHGCNQACDDGCTAPLRPAAGRTGRADRPAADGDAAAQACRPGTALITDAVASRPPAELAAFLAGVPDLSGLDGWSVVEVMTGYEKVARWAAAGQLAAVAEIARRYPDPQAGWARDALPPTGLAGFRRRPPPRRSAGRRSTRPPRRSPTRWTCPGTAQGLVVDAVALTDRVPAVRTGWPPAPSRPESPT